jgi:hypothetical protein
MAAVALFAFFYPILTAVPLSREGLQARQWFSELRAVGRHRRAGWLVLEVKSIYCPSAAPRHREVQQRRCR